MRSDKFDAKSSTLGVGQIERSRGHSFKEEGIKTSDKYEPGTVGFVDKPEASEQEKGVTHNFASEKAKNK